MNPSFKTVGLIGKYKSPEIAGPLLKLADFLTQRGVKVLIDRLTASHIGDNKYPVLVLEEIGRQADLAVVLGGDGTMLNIARTFAPCDVALVGVNQGRLGFLTDISIDTMFETIGTILEGNYVTEERMLLEAEVFSGESSVFTVLAFNDVVISKGIKGSMIELEVRIDGQFLYTVRADGLIVASPTGSTAYALSSGGPIVHPSLSVMALVPICPHTFSSRPIVISSDSVVEIIIGDAADARAHFDSHSRFDLREQDHVVVRRYGHTIRLLHPVGHDYYSMLREKLHWTEFY
ncbi:MAG: NAD kinase [Betaproteobacteria bacterium]|nr:NAD kinase [Betaproteobacteria bacterium]MBI2226512.1 NAD kinase [Betaproteobacteria bacterium]MBI2290778.1 NAD kinase [Betaproteobacteria bacterium]MBI3055934.1 NAD kinase [Betaproteobacteria bacterium]